MFDGWVKLHRKFVEWEWYSDINTKVLFLHLLIMANHKDKNWRGMVIKRGQRLTSLEAISKETGLSISQIRTSLNKLILTNEVTNKSSSKNRIITIVNYNNYQSIDKQSDSLMTNKSQADDKQIATNKNDKNDKNEKNIYTSEFEKFWEEYPRQRKGDKEKSFKAYLVAIKKDLAENILAGVKRYAKSEEVAKGYGKGCAAWLNDSRWLNEYNEKDLSPVEKELQRAREGKFIC